MVVEVVMVVAVVVVVTMTVKVTLPQVGGDIQMSMDINEAIKEDIQATGED